MMKMKAITDKDVIVYLVAEGKLIVDVKKEGNRSRVYFEDNSELDQAILRFINRTGEINISDYIAAERRVKTMLCMQKQ